MIANAQNFSSCLRFNQIHRANWRSRAFQKFYKIPSETNSEIDRASNTFLSLRIFSFHGKIWKDFYCKFKPNAKRSSNYGLRKSSERILYIRTNTRQWHKQCHKYMKCRCNRKCSWRLHWITFGTCFRKVHNMGNVTQSVNIEENSEKYYL